MLSGFLTFHHSRDLNECGGSSAETKKITDLQLLVSVNIFSSLRIQELCHPNRPLLDIFFWIESLGSRLQSKSIGNANDSQLAWNCGTFWPLEPLSLLGCKTSSIPYYNSTCKRNCTGKCFSSTYGVSNKFDMVGKSVGPRLDKVCPKWY